MELSIIIPTKDRAVIFTRTLKSVINAIDKIDAEIIVVNDSQNPISSFANQPNLTIINNKKSGAASARNYGASIAKGRILLFVDNDVLVSNANLKQIIYSHKTYPSSCFNFYWFYPPDLIEKLPSTSFGRYLLNNIIFSNSSRLGKGHLIGKDGLVEVDGLASYFLSINKNDFAKIGGYEEKIPVAGVEDMILAKQMKKNNLKMFLSSSDVVFHNEADRLELINMMSIYKNHALTRKVAVELGHSDFIVYITPLKLLLYKCAYPFKNIIFSISKRIPNSIATDFIYFKVINLLFGISSYEGFYKR